MKHSALLILIWACLFVTFIDGQGNQGNNGNQGQNTRRPRRTPRTSPLVIRSTQTPRSTRGRTSTLASTINSRRSTRGRSTRGRTAASSIAPRQSVTASTRPPAGSQMLPWSALAMDPGKIALVAAISAIGLVALLVICLFCCIPRCCGNQRCCPNCCGGGDDPVDKIDVYEKPESIISTEDDRSEKSVSSIDSEPSNHSTESSNPACITIFHPTKTIKKERRQGYNCDTKYYGYDNPSYIKGFTDIPQSGVYFDGFEKKIRNLYE